MKMEMEMKKMKSYPIVTGVRSDSNPRKVYWIRKSPHGLMCPCMAFRYAIGEIGSHTKTCKHLKKVA